MRYQSFYPFSQSQIPQIPNVPQPPPTLQNGFLNSLLGLGGNRTPAQAPNRFPGGTSQIPFGLGNTGIPQGSNPFSGGPSQNPFSGGNPGNPGIPQGNRMEQYLQTADRFLSTAQQLTPMVQKVTPMVQNLPALWKIYRGFQNMPDATNLGGATRAATTAATAATAVSRSSGLSQPRIFQPPF
ncbi:VrrA/YqfQ family protein [Paenisporosarcina antarctica]|uniref:YqfQ-like protein n=1 Tax=Paenisporosarcina antarctica TaxID=417367 RepID=A0A4P6ZZA8_9BACL|nr:VrrA/YqfQ family protein [Paenisporosarcina antarctica]QBP40886.1 hypothetical protein E2636_07000 [Paenisporosarcina antarctica]